MVALKVCGESARVEELCKADMPRLLVSTINTKYRSAARAHAVPQRLKPPPQLPSTRRVDRICGLQIVMSVRLFTPSMDRDLGAGTVRMPCSLVGAVSHFHVETSNGVWTLEQFHSTSLPTQSA